jgi:hypothetical protein
MSKLVAAAVVVLVLALGVVVGVAVGHSANPRTATVTVASGVTTVQAIPHTVTRYIVHTHTVTMPAPTEPAPAATEPTSTASADCNDLPASGSRTLDEVRESRCEMEKLNAEHPSTANEREIESMISSEREIEGSE